MLARKGLLSVVRMHIKHGIPLACTLLDEEDARLLFQYGIRHLDITNPVSMTLVSFQLNVLANTFLWDNGRAPSILLFTSDMKMQGEFFLLFEHEHDWYTPFLLTTTNRATLSKEIIRRIEK